jgi:TolA-binding protein
MNDYLCPFNLNVNQMKGHVMRNVIILMLAVFTATSAMAHDKVKLAALEKRVKALEARLGSDGALAAPKGNDEQRKKAQVTKARERMREDSTVYSRTQLREIETLYQVANRKWRSQEGKDSLRKMITKYDKANRTGCALLYLGQMSKGQEREEYLKKAINGFSDCFYGNGVQVGAYARYFLAYYYKENGHKAEAEEMFREITSKYPNAVNHKGRFLADLIAN